MYLSHHIYALPRRVSLVEQELLILTEYMSSSPIYGVHEFLVGFVLLDLQFYVYAFQIVVCPFVLFLLAIVLSVLPRLTDSDSSCMGKNLMYENILLHTVCKLCLLFASYHFPLGFLVVIDAKTMTLISHVTAPGEAKFGLHSRQVKVKTCYI